ncbi:hypothetical protein PIROE2DRAFT_18315 [Piromyces sp. E2]|nr:hypothetical protein PIROE2DRAFT_18315 [Piromyces sp. E2]|eukprot:OUM56877.1 hypothetical protein PIROE2DRAFT_18315 [Piromyces sp. E2]
MDIDCDWCICGKKTTNGRLYCSEECKLSDCASDSSANSDFSHLSGHSPTSFMPKFYNASSKKLNKTYVHLLKGSAASNKTLGLGYNYNLNAGPLSSKGHQNNTMNHHPSSPTTQIPLSAKYNQANLTRSSGGLMTSPIMGMGMNMNTTVVTTHINTSGHIIQASTSAPKITEIDSSMIPPTDPYYSRRYSLPVGPHHHQGGQGAVNTIHNNILINITVPDEDRMAVSEQEVEEDGLLTPPPPPPPPFGLITTINTSARLPRGHRHPRHNSNSSSSSSGGVGSGSESPEDDDQTLHSATTPSIRSISNESSLDRLGESHSLRVIPSSSFTKTLKPISEGMVSQSDTINITTLPPSEVSPTNVTTTTTTTTSTATTGTTGTTGATGATSPGHDQNYTLYKTSASTNLCALNQTTGNVQWKNRSILDKVKMMSGGGVKEAVLNHHHPHHHHHSSHRSSSVESAASTNAVTPIYF